MIPTDRAPQRGKIAAFLTSLTILCLLASAGQAAAEGGVHYTKEGLKEYEQQLTAGQIAAATINKRVGTVRLTMKNGQHFLVHYKAHTEPTVAAALAGKGVTVTVLKPAEAQKEASKAPVKHKLRYIAGGILLVVVIIVGAVLLVDRRRKRMAE